MTMSKKAERNDTLMAMWRGNPNLTLREVGAAFGISKGRVDQIVAEYAGVGEREARRGAPCDRAVSVRLPALLAARLIARAAAEGLGLSDCLRLALEDWLGAAGSDALPV